MTHNTASALTLTNIKIAVRKSHETTCFTASVRAGSKVIGMAKNEGHGGETLFIPSVPGAHDELAMALDGTPFAGDFDAFAEDALLRFSLTKAARKGDIIFIIGEGDPHDPETEISAMTDTEKNRADLAQRRNVRIWDVDAQAFTTMGARPMHNVARGDER